MADSESQEPPETAASTPSSQHASQTGPKSSKDRSCPFCAQAFTSSSLGRHLDLYIKPKNPKPPDGVHHADEIRKMRGGITRRQPKANLKEGANTDASGWRLGSADGTPVPASSSSKKAVPAKLETTAVMDGNAVNSPVNMREGDTVQTTFNAPNWQTTGVINNLPPRAASRDKDKAATPTGQAQRIQEMRRDKNGARVQRPDYANDSTVKLQEAAEMGRAAELALREVLGSLEAAKKRVEPQQLLPDVDFFSLSFPGLCLAILPAPTTLFSPIPFPARDSWTLTPPGQKQFETLNRLIQHRARDIRQDVIERWPDSVVFTHNIHIQGAYEHWTSMTERDQASAWTLEILRAFTTASEQRQKAKLDLEEAQNRIRHLETEYDRLSRCQLPREYLLHPPNTMPAPAAIVKEMQSTHLRSGAAELDYDVDALLSKWRTAVKATTRRPPPPPKGQSAPIYHENQQASETQLREAMIMNGATFGVAGAMPRPSSEETPHPSYIDYETPPNPGVIVGAEDDDDDDADADGDDDSGNFGSYLGRNALVRQSRNQPVNGTLNANGKRSTAPTSRNGRASGCKVLRER